MERFIISTAAEPQLTSPDHHEIGRSLHLERKPVNPKFVLSQHFYKRDLDC